MLREMRHRFLASWRVLTCEVVIVHTADRVRGNIFRDRTMKFGPPGAIVAIYRAVAAVYQEIESRQASEAEHGR